MKTLLMVLAAMEALSGKAKAATQASAGTAETPTEPEVDSAVQCEGSDAATSGVAAEKEARP